jgi:hypothetical protein
MLPGELRLRILRNAHLGPPEYADYEAYFDKIIVRNGRLGVDRFTAMYESLDPWYVS